MIAHLHFRKHPKMPTEIFDEVTYPGFSHGKLIQGNLHSILRIGETIQDFESDKVVEALVFQPNAFEVNKDFLFQVGIYVLEGTILTLSDDEWEVEKSWDLIGRFAQRYHNNK